MEIIAFTTAFKQFPVTVYNPENGERCNYGSESRSLLVLRQRGPLYFDVLECRRDVTRSQVVDDLERQNLPDFGISINNLLYPSINILADGNCLFRCYAHFIFKNHNLHDIIRQLVVHQVLKCWTEVEAFVKSEDMYGANLTIENEEHYKQYMSRSGIFGSHPEIVAFSYLFPSYCLAIYDLNVCTVRDIQGQVMFRSGHRPVTFGRLDGPKLIMRLSGLRDSGHYEIIKMDKIEIRPFVNNLEVVTVPIHRDVTPPPLPLPDIPPGNCSQSNNEIMPQPRDLLDENVQQPKIMPQPIDLLNENVREPMQDHDGSSDEDELFDEIGLMLEPDVALRLSKARNFIDKNFFNDPLGHVCQVCDRMWFKSEISSINFKAHDILATILPGQERDKVEVCKTCLSSLKKNKIPNYATYNGFVFPEMPKHLPKLDMVTERFISPRIPFMQIRRLRTGYGQFGIIGQVINVPVSVNTMINKLPRNVDDYHCIDVHFKRKKLHKSSFVMGLVKKGVIKSWLRYLVETPMYKHYNITVDESFLNEFRDVPITQEDRQRNAGDEQGDEDEVLEESEMDDAIIAQQHTLLWNDDKYLRIAPGEFNLPLSLLFDEHAEELSFVSIYLGQFRRFRDGFVATPFQMSSSELRRSDRRAVTPHHLLYMSMKIMRLRVRDTLTIAFKHIGSNTKVTRAQIESSEYLHGCMERNLAFLKCIPNSAWYWSSRKRDLFAMLRQLGKPSVFLTVSANEVGWSNLLRTLYKFKNQGKILTDAEIADLHYVEKHNLVNEDSVTCVLYFNKLVNILLRVLQSKQYSPFGKYRVIHYFKRIEFQQRGSSHAHILLWLENAAQDILGVEQEQAIEMIDQLVSVSPKDASGLIKLQTHKHTFTCYKNVINNNKQHCRFEAPFMPVKKTVIIVPMLKTENGFFKLRAQYSKIRQNLEKNNYDDFKTFYADNDILSDEHYVRILRAGVKRPRCFVKRNTTETWYNQFNPFVLSLIQSNTDLQLITEEYSCAQYVAEYVNKTNRGLSDLQRKIINIQDENPDFSLTEITRKLGVDLLNNVEMSSQEAAWFLLHLPMSKCSDVVRSIPTVWPEERERIKKIKKDLDRLGVKGDSTDIWKENCMDRYENRPKNLEAITLAQFVSRYNVTRGEYNLRRHPAIIRWRGYGMKENMPEYQREMVTLHVPFRNEYEDVLDQLKFVEIYKVNENDILKRRKEFESNLDIEKTIEECQKLFENNDDLGADQMLDGYQHILRRGNDPFDLVGVENQIANADISLAALSKLGPVAKLRDNLIPREEYYSLMRSANQGQKRLLLHTIQRLLTDQMGPLQFFFTGAAGCGKTWEIKMLQQTYNRFCVTEGLHNSFITCASTGKAAVAIDGITVHTALKIPIHGFKSLSFENVALYRTLFRNVKVVFVDECSMISAQLLHQIDNRLKQINGIYDIPFGGLDIIFIGDLRQLPPVFATPIYRPIKTSLSGTALWGGLQYYKLEEVMRQSNALFSKTLTKIGDGLKLNHEEQQLIQSRFFSKSEAEILCPKGVRLFFTRAEVAAYNNEKLSSVKEKTVSVAQEDITGTKNAYEKTKYRRQVLKLTTAESGGLPYEIIFVIGFPYIITTNIDVADGLANGAVGDLCHIEFKDEKIIRIWLKFPAVCKAGRKARKKYAAYAEKNSIDPLAVPIGLRRAHISLNQNKTVHLDREHFPVECSCAMTIHRAQGSTLEALVYYYDSSHARDLVYVALSRATGIDGLFIVPKDGKNIFHHGLETSNAAQILNKEFQKLEKRSIITVVEEFLEFVQNARLSIYSFNIQSLRAHQQDLTDEVLKSCDVLLFNETRLRNDECIEIDNFRCVIQHRRNDRPGGGVAIYQHTREQHGGFYIDISARFTFHTDSGEMCGVRGVLDNGTMILLVCVYLSPDQPLHKILQFFKEGLYLYKTGSSDFVSENYDKIPIIMAGDFNVDFMAPDAESSKKSEGLINFLQETYSLNICNDVKIGTTKHGSCLDAVFSRHIDKIDSKIYCSYFSYHRPIVSIIPNEPSIDP